MSRHTHRAPLRLQPRPSRWLAVFLVLVYGAVAAVALVLPVHWSARAALVLAAAGGLAYGMAHQVLRRLPWSVTGALWEPDGTWTLTLGDGREVEAKLCPSTFVSQSLVVLNFRRAWWWSPALVLPADSLDADLLRRLRARLRATAPESAGVADGAGPIR